MFFMSLDLGRFITCQKTTRESTRVIMLTKLFASGRTSDCSYHESKELGHNTRTICEGKRVLKIST